MINKLGLLPTAVVSMFVKIDFPNLLTKAKSQKVDT